MVNKPSEGICSRCNSENLEFYDDGSGRCMNCGRTFKWASEEKIAQQTEDEDYSQKEHQETPSQESKETLGQQTGMVSGVSRTNGYRQNNRRAHTPNQRDHVVEKPSRRGFLWLGVTGLIFMMAGYILLSLFTMDIGLSEHQQMIQGLYILLTTVGVLMAGMGMMIYGAVADDLDGSVRMGLIIGSSLLIAIYLGIGQLSIFVF
ncbi:MAG: hypothetical protein ACQEQM_07475 [Thermoplasmatota archaeon]